MTVNELKNEDPIDYTSKDPLWEGKCQPRSKYSTGLDRLLNLRFTNA